MLCENFGCLDLLLTLLQRHHAALELLEVWNIWYGQQQHLFQSKKLFRLIFCW